MAGDGIANTRIATTLSISRPTLLKWRARFLSDGLDSVGTVRAGRGRKPRITQHQVQAIVHATLHETPPGATHWSCRSMAKAAGVGRSTVQRIWDAHGLQPHRVKTFKLSTDPAFTEKLTDVVGLYLNPPDKAVVLCVDEKSQIQALDRTQPGLPMKPGRRGTMTHDYKRHGTTTLFAALNVLTGKVIGQCHGRHRHQEFLKFLRRLNRAFPPESDPARHPRQLRDPQARGGAQLAGRPSALSAALQADQRLVAQLGRELVQQADAAAPSARRLLQRAGIGRGHQRLPEAPQRGPEARSCGAPLSTPSSTKSRSVKSF